MSEGLFKLALNKIDRRGYQSRRRVFISQLIVFLFLYINVRRVCDVEFINRHGFDSRQFFFVFLVKSDGGFTDARKLDAWLLNYVLHPINSFWIARLVYKTIYLEFTVASMLHNC